MTAAAAVRAVGTNPKQGEHKVLSCVILERWSGECYRLSRQFRVCFRPTEHHVSEHVEDAQLTLGLLYVSTCYFKLFQVAS